VTLVYTLLRTLWRTLFDPPLWITGIDQICSGEGFEGVFG